MMDESQFPPRPTRLAWDLLRPMIREGDVVIDATAGNGHDTLFLAECVGSTGRVLAFDVQQEAIESAKNLLDSKGLLERAEFYQESHEQISSRCQSASIAVVMFNLGYLPGGDKSLATDSDGTLNALNAATVALKPGGILSVVCYPGHSAGANEAASVTDWFRFQAMNGWRIARYEPVGTLRPAPFLLIAAKQA